MQPSEAPQPDPGRPDSGAFDEPWQAQAFALTVALNEAGVFDWAEWAQALSAQLHADDAKDDGSDYYTRWTAALEALLIGKGVASEDQIAALSAAWRRAAEATPHGVAIELANDPAAHSEQR